MHFQCWSLWTHFLVPNHQSKKGNSTCGVRSCRPKYHKIMNHVLWLKTHLTSKWSRVSTFCTQSAQSSVSLKPWWCNWFEVQQRPCKTSQPKKQHLLGAWIFQMRSRPARWVLPTKMTTSKWTCPADQIGGSHVAYPKDGCIGGPLEPLGWRQYPSPSTKHGAHPEPYENS
jgi:hypothetical protein